MWQPLIGAAQPSNLEQQRDVAASECYPKNMYIWTAAKRLRPPLIASPCLHRPRAGEAKRKHDRLMNTAHGSAFLSCLVVYYFLNWCWVCFLIIASELDEMEECIFSR